MRSLGGVWVVRIQVWRVGTKRHDAHADLCPTGEHTQGGAAGLTPVAGDASALRTERRGQNEKKGEEAETSHGPW